MDFEEFINAVFVGMIKGTIVVVIRKTFQDNEKTTNSRRKQKGGLVKR